jgi:hypothetical protein
LGPDRRFGLGGAGPELRAHRGGGVRRGRTDRRAPLDRATRRLGPLAPIRVRDRRLHGGRSRQSIRRNPAGSRRTSAAADYARRIPPFLLLEASRAEARIRDQADTLVPPRDRLTPMRQFARWLLASHLVVRRIYGTHMTGYATMRHVGAVLEAVPLPPA